MTKETNKDDFNNETSNFPDQDTLFEHFRLTADKGQTLIRIDKYLTNSLAGISRNRIQEAATAQLIKVNGQTVKANYRVKPNDQISVLLGYPPNETEIIPQNIPINIVYEDDEILLVNKQAGLVVHPGFGNYDKTLLHAVAWHWKDNPAFDLNNPRIGLVHRIDKDTSGLLLLAKTEASKTALGQQFLEKTTQRTYQAIVWGIVKENQGTIEGALARDNRDRTRFRVYDKEENPLAKHAITHYTVIKRFAYVTLIECRLETGRTHQIRVHMSHIGHPLFNDERYGGSEILKGVRTNKYKQFITNCFEICPRQALHAKTLGFIHPKTGETMLFDSKLPDDMQQLLNKWQKYTSTNEITDR